MHSHLAMMLGTYIFETRNLLNMTQKSLAESLGVSGQFLGKIEKGEVMIPENLLVKCIRVLGLEERKLLKIYRVSGEKKAAMIYSSAFRRKRKLRMMK